MKKGIIIVAIVMVIFILIGIIVVNLNPLRKNETKLRETLLLDTPLGMNLDDILTYIEGNEDWEIRRISLEHGFTNQSFIPEKIVGEKFIRVKIGEYSNLFTTSVTVFWGFNADSELIDIWVWKTTDSF